MLKNACLACTAITHPSAEVAAAQPKKNTVDQNAWAKNSRLETVYFIQKKCLCQNSEKDKMNLVQWVIIHTLNHEIQGFDSDLLIFMYLHKFTLKSLTPEIKISALNEWHIKSSCSGETQDTAAAACI